MLFIAKVSRNRWDMAIKVWIYVFNTRPNDEEGENDRKTNFSDC